ncbi:MAG: hypothetical protein ACREJM_04785 [Candidatus Saccharimonadales bacterium]
MLIAAALALVVCRLLGAWHSDAGNSAAGLVMAALAIGIVSVSPRLRRLIFCLSLPLAVATNAATLAIGLCLSCMGSQGLLAGGRLGMTVPWTPLFWCVPFAAGISLCALAKSSGAGYRNRRGAALAANLAIAAFALSYWTIHAAQVGPNSPPPLGGVLLLFVAAISSTTLLSDSRDLAPASLPNRRTALWRMGFVTTVTLAILTTILVAFPPVYRHRQTITELESLGFSWMPGGVSP